MFSELNSSINDKSKQVSTLLRLSLAYVLVRKVSTEQNKVSFSAHKWYNNSTLVI